MLKAFTSTEAKEVAQMARECFGGNGILHSNHVMRAMADLEICAVMEGTIDINTLICARFLTGVSAFKTEKRRRRRYVKKKKAKKAITA